MILGDGPKIMPIFFFSLLTFYEREQGASSSPSPGLGKVVDARQTIDQTMKFQGRSVLDHVPGTGGSIQNGVHTRFNALVVGVGYIEKAVSPPGMQFSLSR